MLLHVCDYMLARLLQQMRVKLIKCIRVHRQRIISGRVLTRCGRLVLHPAQVDVKCVDGRQQDPAGDMR